MFDYDHMVIYIDYNDHIQYRRRKGKYGFFNCITIECWCGDKDKLRRGEKMNNG